MGIKTTFNHLEIYVSDKKISFAFYKDLLSYLDYEVILEDEDHLGMKNGSSEMWFKEVPEDGKEGKYSRRNVGLNHLAFGVSKKEDVDKFVGEFLVPKNMRMLYDSPKPFPQYTENYYAVYFEDPDKIKLEVVFL